LVCRANIRQKNGIKKYFYTFFQKFLLGTNQLYLIGTQLVVILELTEVYRLQLINV
jgi:hypothetical protein